MRLDIIAVGRAPRGPVAEMVKGYADRVAGTGQSIGLGPLSVTEVEDKRPPRAAERRPREAELLLAAIPPDATVIALDQRGKQQDSEAFAGTLARLRDEGVRDVAFVIGGADGLDPDLLATAGLVLSLGPMTWPHLLVRAMLAEQVYRAVTILAGHPYHRG